MHEDGEEGLTRHLTKTGTLEEGIAGNTVRKGKYKWQWELSEREG